MQYLVLTGQYLLDYSAVLSYPVDITSVTTQYNTLYFLILQMSVNIYHAVNYARVAHFQRIKFTVAMERSNKVVMSMISIAN